jgi:hypothetical protein
MDLSLYAGDSRNIIINVVDQNNTVVPLFGATIEWVLADNQGSILLTKQVGSGISIADSAKGQFVISITSNNTASLNGTYQHAARVTIPDGESSIVLAGTVTVAKGLI